MLNILTTDLGLWGLISKTQSNSFTAAIVIKVRSGLLACQRMKAVVVVWRADKVSLAILCRHTGERLFPNDCIVVVNVRIARIGRTKQQILAPSI